MKRRDIAALPAIANATGLTAARYLDGFADALEAGDAVGEDLDRALDIVLNEDSEDPAEQHRAIVRLATLALAWLACVEARPKPGKRSKR